MERKESALFATQRPPRLHRGDAPFERLVHVAHRRRERLDHVRHPADALDGHFGDGDLRRRHCAMVARVLERGREVREREKGRSQRREQRRTVKEGTR